MDKRNSILLAISDAGHEAAMDAIRRYLIYNAKGRHEHLEGMIADNTIEPVEAEDGAYLTSDGRPIFWYANKPWATKPEVHAQRLAEAMEQARQRDAALAAQKEQTANTATQATTCAALIDGQLCGGTLIRAAVCPRCALGKSGVAATLTCDVCGHVTAVMRGGE